MKMEKFKNNIINFILLFSAGFFLFSLFSSQLKLTGNEDKEIKKEALQYVNEEILPMEGLKPNAEIAQIDKITEDGFTHYILMHHEEVEIEGKRKEDGSYEFSVK